MTKEYLVATDVETTGLDPAKGDKLMEIAVYVLENKYPYNIVDEKGFHRTVKNDREEAWDMADDFVKNMHEKTGLWDKLEYGTPVDAVDLELLIYLKKFMNRREGRIMGNSIRLDMNFMDAYLPLTADWLHYRSLDISALSWFANQEFDVPFYEKDKSAAHTADGDIKESIKELKHVRDSLDNHPDIEKSRSLKG